ncbi:Bardet-Biedl syndrome 7 protein [Schistosoma japonicum]|uniref:Bardet-Biedl syndrome 7 protein n=1 Tax=Schistosoma japonicum TaxID=6182 RepID=A0A4Z2DNY9_SCHJA|nr:Bardet-Biedl syndrome 7 protein [Schistosoma japonicum]
MLIKIETTNKNSANILLLSSKVNSNQHCKCTLIVADTSGEIHLFQYINELKHIKFSVELPITCIGIYQQNNMKQRIIICHNFYISEFTFKGKQLFKYHINIQGYVNSIFIQSTDIYYTVGSIYQKLTNFKDVEFLLLPDIITSIYVIKNDVICSTPLVILACKDKLIRVLKNGVLLCELELSSHPVCLSRADKSYPTNYLMYGTSEGCFGLFQVTSSSKFGTDEILSLEHYDMLNYADSQDNNDNDNDDSEDQLIIAYSCGRIQLYKYNQYKYPLLIYETNVNYHLTSVKVGRFSNVNYPELLCVTYTGLIFGLTTEPIRKKASDAQTDPMQHRFMLKMNKLNEEIVNLENQLQLLKSTQQQNENEYNFLIPLELDYKFYLNKEILAYCLNVETQISIDHILVQSDCSINLLDVEESTAVRSSSVCTKDDGNVLLTTYRCQVNTTQFEIQFRTTEGQYGHLLVYVVPKTNLSTVIACKCIKLLIHPLSLHCSIHHVDDEPLNRPWNSLQLNGNFSITEMHNWLSICLPDTPERPIMIASNSFQDNDNNESHDDEEYAQLFYESIYLKSQLKCIYTKGQANLQSDNLSTISILKDVLTKEATRKKIQLSIKLDIHMDSVEYMLRNIHTKLIYLKDLEEKVKLINPLTELILNKIQCINEMNKTNSINEQIH